MYFTDLVYTTCGVPRMNQEHATCQKTNLTLRDSNPRLAADRRDTDSPGGV
jgi:hypothetical protein